MFYGQCWKCGQRWELGTASTCTCPDESPKREWQGLTDEEIHQAFCHVEYETTNNWHKNPESWCIANARYLEAILKGRNT